MAVHALKEDGIQIGGAMTDMRIGAVNGSLSEISVEPVDDPSDGESVILQVGDRILRLKPGEVHDLVTLLQLAHGVNVKKRYRRLIDDLEKLACSDNPT